MLQIVEVALVEWQHFVFYKNFQRKYWKTISHPDQKIKAKT